MVIGRSMVPWTVVLAVGSCLFGAEARRMRITDLPPQQATGQGSDLPAQRLKAVEGMLQYLDGEIRSLERLQATRGVPDQALALAISRMRRHAATLGRMNFRQPGQIGKAYAGEDPYAYYLKAVDPGSIYLLDKFFEPSSANPNVDSPDEIRVKMQLYMAERLSLLMHELGHGGMLNYRTDQLPPDMPDIPNLGGEVQLRPGMGTGDADCYLAQYYVLRVLMDQPRAEYNALKGQEFSSAVLMTVLSQLKAHGVIRIAGDLSDPAVFQAAMEMAEMALAIKWGTAVPKTLGRRMAEPPTPLVQRPMPPAEPQARTGEPGRTVPVPAPAPRPIPAPTAKPVPVPAPESEEARGARVAAAWSQVVERQVASRNNNKEGDVYRLQWLAPFTFKKKDNRGFLVGCYCMWHKAPGRPDNAVFQWGNSAQDPGWIAVDTAVAGVMQYNKEHPDQKIAFDDR